MLAQAGSGWLRLAQAGIYWLRLAQAPNALKLCPSFSASVPWPSFPKHNVILEQALRALHITTISTTERSVSVERSKSKKRNG